MKRRTFALYLSTLATANQLPAFAQTKRNSIVIGMTLEPPGLDPTSNAASAIAEVVLYNVFETLTKIEPEGSVSPLLAQSWELSDDLRTITFHLLTSVKFSNGQPLNAAAVKFSLERAAAHDSTNKNRQVFAAIEKIDTPDDHTVVVALKNPDPNFLFYMGQATAAIVEPQSTATNANQPVGTGPYVLQRWAKGSSIALKASPNYRHADKLKIRRATFRFISDPAAQIASILSGYIDVFTRISPRGTSQFKSQRRLQMRVCGSRAKTVLAINHRHKPLNDVRVRRAISAAINRKAIIAAAADGYGVPIGSHYVPGMPGYIDTTDINAYNVEHAKDLLKQAGVTLPLELTLVLPPPPYARQGGEVIVAQLAEIGIQVKVKNVEWAQWLAHTFSGEHDFDLTLISHVEPFDLDNFTKPEYYWGYQNPKFNALYTRIKNTVNANERNQLLAAAQRMLAEDAVLVWLYQPKWVTVAKQGVQGLWSDMPIFVNDVAALSWS